MSNPLAGLGLRRVPGLPLATLAMVALGLALYQLTSLELGLRAHDFQVNLGGAPAAADLGQPQETAGAFLGQVFVGLQSTPAPTLKTARRESAASAVGASTATAPAVHPLPIIGRCQNRWTGLSSATSPSNGWGRGVVASLCWGAVGRG
jgi:hypothetical protein